MKKPLYIGLMSGTSLDAIDVALCRFEDSDCAILDFKTHPLPEELRTEINTLSNYGELELERLYALHIKLGLLFGEAALVILNSTGFKASQIAAVCSHGQTIRHKPNSEEVDFPFSIQIGDPHTISEKTGITTIADFRNRDIAAGGQGAPLVPAFHQAVFASKNLKRAIVNIGGIANVTILDGQKLLAGFDTGPGNTLLDNWIQKSLGDSFDSFGKWARNGNIDNDLLDLLLSEDFFYRPWPKSTGKELFNLDWLNKKLEELQKKVLPQNVQASLCELTARSIANAISEFSPDEVYICGGGAKNTYLVDTLTHHLLPAKVESTKSLGFDPDQVEAAAFAWLGHRTLSGLTNNSPIITGARGERILGAIYQSQDLARN